MANLDLHLTFSNFKKQLMSNRKIRLVVGRAEAA